MTIERKSRFVASMIEATIESIDDGGRSNARIGSRSCECEEWLLRVRKRVIELGTRAKPGFE